MNSGEHPPDKRATALACFADWAVSRTSAEALVGPEASDGFHVAPPSVVSWTAAGVAGHGPVAARHAVFSSTAASSRVGATASAAGVGGAVVAAGAGVEVRDGVGRAAVVAEGD